MARRRRKVLPLPTMMAELFCASSATVLYRSWMMSQGTCSPAEMHRMLQEKMLAAQESGFAMAMPNADAAAVLAPWHRRATANARRLRRKKP